jgi:hypothetical protein
MVQFGKGQSYYLSLSFGAITVLLRPAPALRPIRLRLPSHWPVLGVLSAALLQPVSLRLP